MRLEKIRLDGQKIKALSPLEEDVLKILWGGGKELRVRDVYAKTRKNRRTALTSVAVILDRLHKKKLVTRRTAPGLGGYHYFYSPLLTRESFESSVVAAVVERLIGNFGSVAVNYFNERFGDGERTWARRRR